MRNQTVAGPAIFACLCLSLAFGSTALSRVHWQDPTRTQKGAIVTTHATGTFDVKLTPQPSEDKTDDATLARMTIDKQIHGDLEATSKGQMLTAGTPVKGSAGYVAIERISGTLRGRTGTFILQHTGTMTRGTPQLSITVVPDSGTGQLVGLTGTMSIQITDGKHSYDFAYTLP
jgi:uncharacterized protein DUF3224